MAVFDFIPKVNNFEDRKPKPAPDQEYRSIDPGGRPITGMEEQIREDQGNICRTMGSSLLVMPSQEQQEE